MKNKKIGTLFLRHLPRKYCRLFSLKTKKNLEKDANYLELAWHSKRQKENIEKEKEKQKMKKSQTKTINIFLPLLFYKEKFMIF